ncbi:MAG: exopolysaccharide Pel transporter PelG [Thiothrix sp.]|uniref:exopolysaccharide Pel transporter PelG n=1 Tax=Thiothrix sp. TaxID=1032 RepID=UPI00263369EC|nr:exopolysaccharide Pel transporter PelG [Thiothrix sp.]MDD5392672.1 exopolysaccharide Pel transporter PelG [Thiothrix sp.]
MAGIGFELKKMMDDGSWFGLAKAYTYAGIIGSGPWVLSIIGILLVGGLGLAGRGTATGDEFVLSVTYLISLSLILSGALQLVFVRFVSDRIYQGDEDLILPNVLGAIGVMTLVSGVIGTVLALTLFRYDPVYAVLMLVNFVVLCNVWVVVVFVAGMKNYHAVLITFFAAYGGILALAWLLRGAGTAGGLIAVLVGHSYLLLALLVMVMREYRADMWLRLDFLQLDKIQPSLIVTGVCFNLGVWVDKWIFWFYPATSDAVNAVLRASVIYDLPFFLAYLSIVPGMASFLIRVETDFVETYRDYYSTINGRSTLAEIKAKRETMITSVRDAFWEIVKIQGLTLMIFFLLADDIIAWLGLSSLYVHLYYLDLVATMLQVLFLTTLSITFYFNLLRQAMWMTIGLFISNATLTLISLWLGPSFYGYGFALSLLGMTVAGMAALSGKLNRLEYLTFMMQR